MEEPAGFRDFVAARSSALVRSAWLLTGDEAAAEDLVQAALVKTWTRWSRIERHAPQGAPKTGDLPDSDQAASGTDYSKASRSLNCAPVGAIPARQHLVRDAAGRPGERARRSVHRRVVAHRRAAVESTRRRTDHRRRPPMSCAEDRCRGSASILGTVRRSGWS